MLQHTSLIQMYMDMDTFKQSVCIQKYPSGLKLIIDSLSKWPPYLPSWLHPPFNIDSSL